MLKNEIDRILGLIDSISSTLMVLTGVLVSLVFLYFFLGAAEYVRKEEALEEIRKKILWGIIGVTAIVSVWGAIHFLQESIFGPTYNRQGGVDIETIRF